MHLLTENMMRVSRLKLIIPVLVTKKVGVDNNKLPPLF